MIAASVAYSDVILTVLLICALMLVADAGAIRDALKRIVALESAREDRYLAAERKERIYRDELAARRREDPRQ